jgi:hypothetical protein
VLPELPRIIAGFISWYAKFPNKIRVPDVMGSGSGIPGSGIGLRVFCPGLVGPYLMGVGGWRGSEGNHSTDPQ